MLKRRDESIANQETFVVLDIPLLFESKLESLVDKIIVVSVTKELQLERLIKRNQLTEEEALSRIRSQMPLEEKVSRADNVIDNSGTLEETKQQLEEILSCWA
jgi:dephospho-CoA kinase